jgi:acetyl/propionyl-CoA carboxylase alpha subunit
MLQVHTGTQKTWNITLDKNQIRVDQNPFDWDVVQLAANTFHILKDHISYTAELVEADYESKKFVVKVNGERHEIQIKDRFDLLLDKLGLSQANTRRTNDLRAPMPGLVLEIKAQPGQEVKQGDPLLILEAMKMENILKAPGDGKIRAVNVHVRQNVEKNQVLIEFEEGNLRS